MTRYLTPIVAASAAFLITAAAPEAAQAQGKKPRAEAPASSGGGSASTSVQVQVSISPFSSREREVIQSYITGHKMKAKPLPPGIAKNLARGKPLPPGIAKQTIPADLHHQLSPRPDTELLIVGDQIVIVDPVGLVVDIFKAVF